MRKTPGTVTAIAALLLLSWPAWPQGPVTTQPLDSTERQALQPSREMLDHGLQVATTTCASCHGIDGIGTAPGVSNLAGQRTVYLYRVLQSYQSRDRRDEAMNHAVGFLNREALLAVAAYYASLAPARPMTAGGENPSTAAFEVGDPFAGIRDDLKKCGRCHGEDGNASASGMPNLGAQSPEYFVTSMLAYADGGRDHKMMGRLVAGLDEATLNRMGVFYGVQEPARTATVGDGNPDLGRELAEPCAGCHGADGNTTAADMPSLAGQDARYFIKAMAAYQNGTRQHEAMLGAVEGLSESDLADLAAFYAVQEPVRRNVRAPLTTAQWITRCERCHGVDGNSTDPRFPMLAAQDRTYLINALRSYAGDARSNSTMHAMSAPLSAADIDRIADFYATREAKSVLYLMLPCYESTVE